MPLNLYYFCLMNYNSLNSEAYSKEDDLENSLKSLLERVNNAYK